MTRTTISLRTRIAALSLLVIVGLVTLLVRFDTLAVLHDNSHNRLMDWHISHTIECFWRITVDTSPLINKLCIDMNIGLLITVNDAIR